MTYEDLVFEVEFAGKDGRAYAILPTPLTRVGDLYQRRFF